MESILNLLPGGVLASVMSVAVPAIVVFVVRYLHSLVGKTKFAQNSQVDEFVFKMLEREAVTLVGSIMKAEGPEERAVAKREAATKAIENVKGYAKDVGIDMARKYSEKTINIMLHQAIHNLKRGKRPE